MMRVSTRKPKAVLFDVDGTLCDVTNIRHYVMGDHKDFDSFHKASLFCPPVEWVARMAASLEGATKLVVTGRSARYRHTTDMWLGKYDINYTRLFMRPDHDQRPDYEVKRDILLHQILPFYDVIFAVDDNPNVVRLWCEYHIPVMVVPGWEEEAQAEAILESAVL
jgi:FMN phosphatase YigB (HAD superfamily)